MRGGHWTTWTPSSILYGRVSKDSEEIFIDAMAPVTRPSCCFMIKFYELTFVLLSNDRGSGYLIIIIIIVLVWYWYRRDYELKFYKFLSNYNEKLIQWL